MSWESAVSIANAAALPAWAWLLFLPRWIAVRNGVLYGLIGALCLAYAGLVLAFFFRVGGGGFGSIAHARLLFASDPALLAGWLHYLAFDLFAGLWIAGRFDAASVSRRLQAPVLAATFMCGPLGLLLAYGVLASQSLDAGQTLEDTP